MEFGVSLDVSVPPGGTQQDALNEAFRTIDLAEELGVDAVWLQETHFDPNRPTAAPIILAAAIAARTKRLKIGMAVQILPLIHPLRIAEEAATVDQISQGRFEFGVGRSNVAKYYDIMGLDYAESKERFQESLEIILKAWSGETFSYEGKYNHIANATLSPLPYQQPHPKIRIAAASEDSFGNIGRLGYPIFLNVAAMNVEDLKANLQEYHQEWKNAGHPGKSGDINVRFPVYIAPTDEEAFQEPKESIENAFKRARYNFEYSLESGGGSRAGFEDVEIRKARYDRMANISYDELLETRAIIGSPKLVIDRLTQFQEQLGLTSLTASLNPGSQLPKAAANRTLELLAKEVMPAFR